MPGWTAVAPALSPLERSDARNADTKRQQLNAFPAVRLYLGQTASSVLIALGLALCDFGLPSNMEPNTVQGRTCHSQLVWCFFGHCQLRWCQTSF